MILDKVNTPDDLKKLSLDELNTLADEMRAIIIKKVNTTGGHMGPNLGVIEATIAMHYVFNSPVDKIVFDVSHQCYPHKILTGRKEGFTNPEKFHVYTGYTAPEESAHDLFKVGHTSTSVSLASGVAKARDLKGEKGNVIALIGDGSLTGGEALEGLDNAAVLGSNIIIVVNDNDMSIAENHGGIYDNLKLLRETNGKAECNFFKSVGFDYYYVDDGNNIEKMIEVFKKVKDTGHPVVVHMKTVKGHGLAVAEQNKEAFHWIMPGTLDEKPEEMTEPVEDYNSVGNEFLMKKAKADKSVVIINPATPGVHGFSPEYRKQLGLSVNNFAMSDMTSKIAVVDVNQVVSASSQVEALKKEQQTKMKEVVTFVEKARKEVAATTDTKKKQALEEKYNKELNTRRAAIEKNYATKLSAIDAAISNQIANQAKLGGYDIVLAKGVVLYGGSDITEAVKKAVK